MACKNNVACERCSHNLLETLPVALFHLNRLLTLHIDNNRLTVVHNDIGYLDQLEDLVCMNVDASFRLVSFSLLFVIIICFICCQCCETYCCASCNTSPKFMEALLVQGHANFFNPFFCLSSM